MKAFFSIKVIQPEILVSKDSESIDSQGSTIEDPDMEEISPSPIYQVDGMVPVLPQFVPPVLLPNVPGAPPPIQPLAQHLMVPVGPGLPPNGQFGLVGPFAPWGTGHIPSISVINCRNTIVAALATVPNLKYKDAQFLFTEILNVQNRFKPLANATYFPSIISDEDFHDLSGLTKLQFYDLRNRLEHCGLDFSDIYKGNSDSELLRTLCAVRNIISFRKDFKMKGM